MFPLLGTHPDTIPELNWGQWLGKGIPNPIRRNELPRLVLIGDFPLPLRGVPLRSPYILDQEIHSPYRNGGPEGGDSGHLATADELRVLMRMGHRSGLRLWRELVIGRLRMQLVSCPRDFERSFRESNLRDLAPDVAIPGIVGTQVTWDNALAIRAKIDRIARIGMKTPLSDTGPATSWDALQSENAPVELTANANV